MTLSTFITDLTCNIIHAMNTDEQRDLDGLRLLDTHTISEVYDRYFPSVFRFVRYRLGDDSLAEDLSSDVFVRLLEASRAGRGPQTNLKAWLLSTASHIVNDHLRRSYRRPTSELPETLADSASNPVEDIEHRERRGKIHAALAHLTTDQQTVIALRFGQELSLEETAKVMNKNINAIKQLQLRALAALNRKVEEAL